VNALAPSQKETQARVTELYTVFRPYATGPASEGCPCCVHETDRRTLRRAPLQELTWSDLSHFARKAITTWGDADSFRHYLPRILELIDDDPPVDREIILGKLRIAEWRKWPAKEQAAVSGYLFMIWKRLINSPDADAEEYLCGFACAGVEMNDFLKAWTECRCSSGYRYLADFACSPFTNAFWNQGHREQGVIDEWLLSEQTLGWLNGVFEQDADQSFSGELAAAIDAVAKYQIRALGR
jgi:hypothetical protein